jgi:hypothetical protein
MKNKTVLIILAILLILPSCIKERYDMDKLSGETALSPTVVLRVVKAEMSLDDLVEPDDTTIVFDEDGLVKLVFKEDSIIDLRLADFYEEFNLFSYDETHQIFDGMETDGEETLIIEPGEDRKLKKMSISSGELDYTLRSWCTFDVEVELTVPGIVNGSGPLVLSETIPAGSSINSSINLSAYLASFDADPVTPYNRLPVEWHINIPSPPGTYLPSDSINLWLEVGEPDFDYVTGYFGDISEELERDTLDLETEEFFSKLSGSIYLANPSVTVSYSNSFGVPMRINTEIKGRNDEEEVTLDRGPVDIDYPTSADNRDVSSSFTIDRTNSQLPDLISMFPYEIEFFGSADINPDGETTTDNIIFGNSRLIADLEAFIPMDLSINVLQLSDTTENFLRSDDPEDDNPLEMLEEMTFDLYVENGFPLDASVIIELYDSTSMSVLETIDPGKLIQAAPVDNNGRVTEPEITTVPVEVTPAFIDAVEEADAVILSFMLNTTDSDTREVKIYSDYNIVFAVAIRVKAGINLNFNSEDE